MSCVLFKLIFYFFTIFTCLTCVIYYTHVEKVVSFSINKYLNNVFPIKKNKLRNNYWIFFNSVNFWIINNDLNKIN